jgi:tRNA(Ile)-lysidine synthase
MNSMDLIVETERIVREELLIREGDGVVVAVSGGPDSMALLHVMLKLADRLKLRVVAAHMNHMFRGEESAEEADFVANYAAAAGIPCEVVHCDIPRKAEQQGGNPHAIAREERYRFLLQTAKQHRCQRIALAHHADDQAETVLMRLLRGTGPSGLAGIPARRTEQNVELIRPFLRIYKQTLVAYCEQQGLEYRIDSSNKERKYYRNRIRLDALPYLKQYNPQLSESLIRLSDMMRAEDDFLDQEAGDVLARWSYSDGMYEFPRKEYMHLHLALQRRCLKLILKYVSQGADVDFRVLEDARKAVVQESTPSLRLNLPGCTMVREYDNVCLIQSALEAEQAVEPFELEWTPGPELSSGLQLLGPGITMEWSWMTSKEARVRSDSRLEVWFDGDQIRYPLRFRPRKAGDRIRPFGLNGTKKVKDMYVDEKLPPAHRLRLPVLADGEGTILWIPGVRRSDHALVNEMTARVLYMKVFIEWMDPWSHRME